MDDDERTNIITASVGTIIDGFEEDELMEPWAYHLAAIALFLIGLFGFTLNLFVIILMCRDVQLWTPMNTILFNLVCSDFLVSILGNPLTLTAALSHRWIFGQMTCIAYGFFMSLLGIASITTLTVLAYERYCLVAYPLSSHQITNRGAVFCIALIWIYSLSLTTPPLFGWGAYVNEAANISCSVNWESKSLNATTYIVFLFVFGLVVPVVIILYSYTNIILTMKKNSIRLGRKNRAERRVTLMIAIMIIAFLVAWTPYASFALLEQFGPPDLITPKMAVLPALIAKSSICYNPLIYVGLNTQFRASWKKSIGKASNIVETTANQTQTSSHSFDCTPKFVRQGKEKLLKAKLNSLRQSGSSEKRELSGANEGLVKSGKMKMMDGKQEANALDENCDMKISHSEKFINHELTVFSEGKSILIRSNSYRSNII